MKESVAAFERRTGERYHPPPRLRVMGDRLAPRESCPTLFRFPGPEALQILLQGHLRRLSPPGLGHVWLTSRPTGAYPRAVELFGTVAVLEPLRFQACRTHCFTHKRDNWIGLDRTLDGEGIVWVPPSQVRGKVDWDRIRTSRDARRRFGPAYEDERRRVGDRLARYLEEIQELRRAGAPGPDGHWCSVPLTKRRALLSRFGLHTRWTRR